MSQPAQNDHYRLARHLARAVAGDVRDLFIAGADIVQIDDPYLQARPEAAADFGLEVINIALADAPPTALHTCFGYGHIFHDKPQGIPFLAELNHCVADEISLETAQPRLDLSILKQLSSERIALGVLDLATDAVEMVETVVARAREALRRVEPRAPRAGAGLRDEAPPP